MIIEPSPVYRGGFVMKGDGCAGVEIAIPVSPPPHGTSDAKPSPVPAFPIHPLGRRICPLRTAFDRGRAAIRVDPDYSSIPRRLRVLWCGFETSIEAP
jgi:hypothetical protein